MSQDAKQFFVGEEPIKAGGPPLSGASAVGNKSILIPVKALCHGKECPHQFFLAAHGDIDMAIAHARANVRVRGTIHAVHCGLGALVILKFNEAIHGLASGPFHDDMDGALRGVDQIRRPAEQLDHFLTSDRVRDLLNGSKTYLAQ